MINRVLIRMKVIQILYSYLLTEKRFELAPVAAVPSKEKRFAHSLYMDMLVLMYKIADNIVKQGERPLLKTRFMTKLTGDERFKALLRKYASEPFALQGAVEPLSDLIKESRLYKELNGKKEDSQNTNPFWEEVCDLVILPNPRLNSLFTKLENYTLNGVEIAKKMLNETFSDFYSSLDNFSDGQKLLEGSLEKSRELYFRLLTLPYDLARLRELQLEENREKYLPTAEDLNPNMRFVENYVSNWIGNNEEVREYCDGHKLNWLGNDRQLLEMLLKKIMQSELYREYMDFPATDKERDGEFWRNVFKNILLNDPDFLEYLESQSIFWNDDLEIMMTFVLKSIKRIVSDDDQNKAILPKYKDREDSEFGATLMRDVLANRSEYRAMIKNAVNPANWDSDRIAFMDIVIIMTALSEIMLYPKIPFVVSLNEYIEIAKSYSTSKSGSFVHGILTAIVKKLNAEGKLNKA